jgi:hypothetical protein
VTLWLWLASAAAGLLLLYLLLLAAVALGILRSYRRTPERVRREFGFAEPEDLGLAGERLTLEVESGITLRGFLFRCTGPGPARGLVVYHHGIWDACRPRLQLAQDLTPRGFDVLLYDSRGHGQSGGRFCTYGQCESADLLCVLNTLGSRGLPVSRVAIVGHSMGAATAVYAAVRDSRIRALVLEACYRDLRTSIRDYARLWIPFLPEFIIRQAESWAASRAGFDLTSLSPLKLLPALTIPVLFVHGTADRRIKPAYAQECFNATPQPRELHWIEGARHGRVWHEGGQAYRLKLATWLDDHMPA